MTTRARGHTPVKRRDWYILVGVSLAVFSAVLYAIHYAIFHDAHHIYIYMLGDLAFLPIEVLIVTIIIDFLLTERDKRAKIEKLNMVIGAFYGEVGTELLRMLTATDSGIDLKRKALEVTGDWDEGAFTRQSGEMRSLEFSADSRVADLQGMKAFLVGERDFMVRLLENPLLLEHEAFSDVLWAVFHLTEELDARADLSVLPPPDMDHLSVDMSRAYKRLAGGWLAFMIHLRKQYPYLFSFAVRMNPFKEDAKPEITG